MTDKSIIPSKDIIYQKLVENIGGILYKARTEAFRAVNFELVKAYWNIGKHIVEYEQKGKIKAEYGKKLLFELSKELKAKYGKGFSRSNLVYIRLLYIKYPIGETLSHQLSWSHYFELLKIENDLERSFYEKQAISDNWSIRELKRNKESALFERLALSKDKEGIIKLAEKGQIIEKPQDLPKDPYVLEFLNIPEKHNYSESDLEKRIIDNLQQFIMELGKGFAFIDRQHRITINNTSYYVDLVFYHTKLKCYVLIDLKINEVKHYDIGQMNMYLGYFEKEENEDNDNPPIGIILTKEKDDIMVEYATYKLESQLFVSKYQLYLPEKEALQKRVTELLQEDIN